MILSCGVSKWEVAVKVVKNFNWWCVKMGSGSQNGKYFSVMVGYESLIAKLRLVLLTRSSKQFYHPNASTGNRVNTFLLTVRLNFVVSVN